MVSAWKPSRKGSLPPFLPLPPPLPSLSFSLIPHSSFPGPLKRFPCLHSLYLCNSSFIFHLCHTYVHPQSRTYKSAELAILLNPNPSADLQGPRRLALPSMAEQFFLLPDSHRGTPSHISSGTTLFSTLCSALPLT